jgi:CheY-like chemotaxis protein
MHITKVLIVDDSEGDQMLATIAVQRFDPNIDILQAYDGEEALDVLDNNDNKPDVIFLDINMPNMNGHEFLAEYSKREIQSVVIAMLTSSSQDKDKEQAMKYDCVKKYFLKALDEIDLKSLQNL